jgi:acetolactate synthase small subunit
MAGHDARVEKLEDVWSVRDVESPEVIRRETALIKLVEGAILSEIPTATPS